MNCPHCSSPIVPTEDDVCPSCRYNINLALTPEQEWNLAAELESRARKQEGLDPSSRHHALSLIEQRLLLLAFMTAVGCIPAAAALVSGASAITVAILLVTGVMAMFFLFVWAFTYVYAPRAAKGCAVFLVVGMIISSLVSCWIVRSREETIRNSLSNHLRELGFEHHEKLEHQPAAADSVWQRD